MSLLLRHTILYSCQTTNEQYHLISVDNFGATFRVGLCQVHLGDLEWWLSMYSTTSDTCVRKIGSTTVLHALAGYFKHFAGLHGCLLVLKVTLPREV